MQVNSAQDYLTRVNRQVITKGSIVAPPPQMRKTNAATLSIAVNRVNQYNRFIIPTVAPGAGPVGGATFTSYCCAVLASILNLAVASGAGTNAQTLSWTETNGSSRSVVVTYNGVAVSGAVSAVGSGTCVITAQGTNSGVYVVTVTIFNVNGSSASNSINLTIGYPTLTTLIVSSGAGSGNQTLTWSEAGPVASRTVVFTAGSGTVGSISSGTVSLTGVSTSATVVVTLFSAASLWNAASVGTINLSNPCFLGFVPLMTRMGAVAAKYIEAGMEMLQPNGTFSRVLGIKVSTVTHAGGNFENDRLFADEDEKMVVTYWHKVRFEGEEDEIKAGDHPKLHEVFREFPFDVYNFVLESYKDKLLVADTTIIAESFVPVNPA